MSGNSRFVILQSHLMLLFENFASAAISLTNHDVDTSCEPSLALLLRVDIESLIHIGSFSEQFSIQVLSRHAKYLIDFVLYIFVNSHACCSGRFLLQSQVERVVPLVELIVERKLWAACREYPIVEDLFGSDTADLLVRRSERLELEDSVLRLHSVLVHLLEDRIEKLTNLELDHLHHQTAFAVENIICRLVSWIGAAKPAQLGARLRISQLIPRQRMLKWMCFNAFFHEPVQLFNSFHDMIAVQKCATFALSETISYAFTDRHK